MTIVKFGDLCTTTEITTDSPRDANGDAIVKGVPYKIIPENTVVEVHGKWKHYKSWLLCWVPEFHMYAAFHADQIEKL